jgi:hypothetical protein
MNEDDRYLEARRVLEAERVYRGYVGRAGPAPVPDGEAARGLQERAPKATVKAILRGWLDWFKMAEVPQQEPVFSEADRIEAHGLGVRL